jgi:hypothetical protein
VTIELDDPAGTIVSPALELEAADDALVLNSGTATWARIVNGNGDHVLDCDVSLAGGGGEVELSQVILFAGGLVALVSATLG